MAEIRPRPAANPADEPLGRFGRSRLGILAVLFLAVGALGLPLLILSPAFSKAEKIFWGVAVTLYSAALVALIALILLWAWQQLGL